MRLSLSTAAAAALFLVSASTSNAFVTPAVVSRQQFGVASPVVQLSAETTMAESGAPPATSKPSDTAEEDIPTNLPSDVGMDYVPLATMLATGQLAEADQVCVCIKLCSYLSHFENESFAVGSTLNVLGVVRFSRRIM